ncbi:MAG TPA: HAMP domain-containing sensor histidine kinase [Bacteroidia bacterium]|nr:HAMP domain-containing sensor histidine kinase [Bacteroidia bacterium]
MKIVSPKLITFLAGMALVGLCVIQYYWISGAVEQKREHFVQDVREAMVQVSRKYNHTQMGLRLRHQLNYRRQSFVTNNYSPQNGRVNVYEQFTTDSAGHEKTSTRTKSYSGDTLSREYNTAISANTIESSANRQGNVNNQGESNISNGLFNNLFDEVVHINVYNDFSTFIDTALVDSLLKDELMSRGINTHYIYTILNSPACVFNCNHPSGNPLRDSLLTSRYRVSLTADNLFSQPRMLSIYFPNERGYILKSMWLMLLVSALFILFIILLFYYSITTIFRQKHLSEIKNDFISNMTHELKTPISTISLACEVLGDEDISKTKERTHRYLTMIKEENKRLGVLVENVLQTALLDKGNFKLKPTTIDLHEIIHQAIGSVQLAIDKKGGEISSDLRAEKHEIYADHTHIQNIIYNLLDNAIKYTPKNPAIRIYTQDLANGIEFCVQDNGIGISRENQKKIFEKLYRVPTGNIHDVKGFGLGLSYVKAIVEKHGGEVWVDSEPGRGSNFHVRLPYILDEKPLS